MQAWAHGNVEKGGRPAEPTPRRRGDPHAEQRLGQPGPEDHASPRMSRRAPRRGEETERVIALEEPGPEDEGKGTEWDVDWETLRNPERRKVAAQAEPFEEPHPELGVEGCAIPPPKVLPLEEEIERAVKVLRKILGPAAAAVLVQTEPDLLDPGARDTHGAAKRLVNCMGLKGAMRVIRSRPAVLRLGNYGAKARYKVYEKVWVSGLPVARGNPRGCALGSRCFLCLFLQGPHLWARLRRMRSTDGSHKPRRLTGT